MRKKITASGGYTTEEHPVRFIYDPSDEPVGLAAEGPVVRGPIGGRPASTGYLVYRLVGRASTLKDAAALLKKEQS